MGFLSSAGGNQLSKAKDHLNRQIEYCATQARKLVLPVLSCSWVRDPENLNSMDLWLMWILIMLDIYISLPAEEDLLALIHSPST